MLLDNNGDTSCEGVLDAVNICDDPTMSRFLDEISVCWSVDLIENDVDVAGGLYTGVASKLVNARRLLL